MKKLLLVSLCFLMFCITQVFAQNRTVTGTVTAKDDGLPLPGVTVKVKGTSNGVQTNTAGKYTITDVPNGAVLVFSSIGYEQLSLTPTGLVLNAQLTTSSKQLGEVVVTGALGVKRTKNQQSYAAQEVNGDEVSKQRSDNFIDGLSGKVSGLEIRQNNTLGGSTNVVLRGTKSLFGDNQALFVIDGVPIGNDNINSKIGYDYSQGSSQNQGDGGYDYGSPASDINPDDIESVTVLKGAGATALYGARGSNGVILITTKKAAKGLGIVINSTVTTGAIDKSTFPQYQKQYGAGYGQYFNTADIFGNPNAQIAPTSDDASNGTPFDPNLLIYQWDAFDKTSPNYGKATPWVAAKNDPSTFFVKPVSSDQSILITNGGESGSFKLGYTNSDQNGILPNSNLKKNLVDFAATYNITPKLTAGASINFYNTNGHGRGGTGYDGTNSDNRNVMTNFRQWWEVNVDVQELKAAYDRTNSNISWNMASPGTGNLNPAYWNNPYWVVDHNYETDQRNRYLGNVNLDYKVTPWLNILGRISLDSYAELDEERYDVGSIGVPYYSRVNNNYSETNYDLIATVDKNLSSDLNFKAIAGGNIRKNSNNNITAYTNGGLIVPGLYSISNSLNSPLAPNENEIHSEVDGIFAGATLTWKKLLTLDATIRQDKSSTLPAANNTYYYPSVSGGFIFSELLKNATFLSYGKLRASYATVGSDALPYRTSDTYNMGYTIGSSPQTYLNNTKFNNNLKPAQTTSNEIGIELSFLQNRIGFDGSYYKTKTFDQLVPAKVSDATGYNYDYVNTGAVENRGIELSLNATPVLTSNFNWKITFNFTANRNKVISTFKDASGNEASNLQLASFQNGESLNAPLGESYGILRGTDYTYLNGKPVVNSDGEYILTSFNHDIGNINPNWIGGINNSFTYKGINFSFLIDIRKGGSVYSNDLAYGLADGIYPLTAYTNDLGNPVRNLIADGGGFIRPGVYANGKPNTTRVEASNYGEFGDGAGLLPQSAFVYDASYVKLREAILGYTLPKSLLAKISPFKEITFQLIGRNLWIIHKNIPYSDPEEGLSSGNIQGVQEGAYPTVRTFAFNLKLRF